MSIFEAVLPKEWLWACVGDFYAVTKKPRSLNLSAFEKIPFSPMDCIPQGGQFDLRYTYKAAEEIKSGTYFEHGDVLVGKITPCFENGKQALAVNFPAPFGYATTEVIPLHPKDKNQDRRVLFYYLLHPDVRSHITEKMEGATGRQRVPENVLLELAFPRIPFTEQGKIGKILLTVQQAIQYEAAGFEKAHDLKRAAMREVFTRGLRGEAQKTKVSLESLCALISQQVHPRDNPKAIYIGLEHLSSGMFHQNNFGISEDVQSSKFYFKKGDVLYSKLRPYLDKAILADFEGLCTTELLVLRPKNNIPATFLIGVVHFQDFIEYAMAGVAGAQHPRTSWHHIKNYQIPDFPPAEQKEIGELLSAIDDKITLHKRKKAALEALFTSLLHQLMTGKIRVADLDLSALNAPQTEAA